MGTFSPLLIMVPFFLIAPEYTQPYIPILFLWTGHGLFNIVEILRRQFTSEYNSMHEETTNIGRLLMCSVIIYSAFLVYKQVPSNVKRDYHYSHDEGRYDQKKMGILLNKYLPKNAKIMTRWSRIGFYSQRKYVSLPKSSRSEIIDTAKKSGVRYLIIDGALFRNRPQLLKLFKSETMWSAMITKNSSQLK